MSISGVLSTGQGQGQVTKGHQNKKKIGPAAYDLYSLWYVEFKSRRNFAIWLHESQGQGGVEPIPGHIRTNFRIDFSK